MALSVTRARVKEKCSITGTTYDATIDALISEMVPVIEYAIRDAHIDDTANTKLQNTLNLGASEIVCGEFLEQLAREQGAMERVRLGDFELWPPEPSAWKAALLIKDGGWSRLKIYLKQDASGKSGTVDAARTGKSGSGS
jgi:hypothetical protein